MIKYYLLFLLTYLSNIQIINGQVDNFQFPDSLSNRSFKELENEFLKNHSNKDLSFLYANTILHKAKKLLDTSKIMTGFTFLAYVNANNNLVETYSDSLLKYATIKKDAWYLELGYMNKADYEYKVRKFKNSLDNYLFARKYSEPKSRKRILIDHNIGLIKSRLGQDKEAQLIFKKAWNFFNKEKTKKEEPNNYLTTLFSLANNYNRIRQYDSASYYNKLGIIESVRLKNENKLYHFVLNEAVNDFDQGKLLPARDSLTKVLFNKNVLNKPNQIVANYYLGEALHKLNEKDKAIPYFKTVDTLFQEIHDLLPETRGAYERLISFYKERNDKNKQLEYIEQLLEVDSVLSTNYRYLSSKINKEYDTPKLLSEQRLIISNLQNKNQRFYGGFLTIAVLLIISLAALTYYFLRQKRLQAKFDAIISAQITQNSEEQIKKPNNNIGIAPETINEILDQLQHFENTHGYIINDLKISNLAESFKTNPNYLSKIINHHKNKSFTNYVNELRVDYAVNKLKTDPRFRIITIKAVAQEVGFNSAESFAKAFHKKTGLYPSYFIKNLKNAD